MGMQKARRGRSATLVTTRNMKLHMIDEIENRRAAEKFIERFGNDAAREAKIRAAELRAAGDAEGHKNWLVLHGEIECLLKETAGGLTKQ